MNVNTRLATTRMLSAAENEEEKEVVEISLLKCTEKVRVIFFLKATVQLDGSRRFD